ncbi:hypothetical protein [Halomonas koreensis]|uniref:Sulphur transport domain-containing protein n=1 Tax=Halomonas koreensis TaxID=245385 RepID=A0ABU1FZA7_9GAMM|nr:hypothetical protein [Halomonas koreensis]MDR5865534.1 hypothetical protein [Halomonas koreensis]
MNAVARLLGALLSRPASLALILGVGLGYGLLYLWLVGDIAGGGSGFRLAFPAWERAFELRGAWRFEPVGILELGPWIWTFSPLNTLIALGLGTLLGLDLAAARRLRRVARQCPVTAPTGGLLAGLSALLAGGACCAPLLAIWLGLPLAGGLAVLAPWLVPLAYAALALGLWRLAVRQAPGRGEGGAE